MSEHAHVRLLFRKFMNCDYCNMCLSTCFAPHNAAKKQCFFHTEEHVVTTAVLIQKAHIVYATY